MSIGGWQVVLSGVQDAGLTSAGVGGLCQSCGPGQSDKERRGTQSSNFVHLKNIYLKNLSIIFNVLVGGHGNQRTTLLSQVFPSIFTCVPGIELGLSDLQSKCFYLEMFYQLSQVLKALHDFCLCIELEPLCCSIQAAALTVFSLFQSFF